MHTNTTVCPRCNMHVDPRLIFALTGWCTDCVIIWAEMLKLAQTGQIDETKEETDERQADR